jgi:REP element-mobilizing transposase RayT
MANTYTQINIHGIFAVHGRENFLIKEIRSRLFEYISGIIRGMDLFPLAVNGYTDHVHIFFELAPELSTSKVMQVIKSNSSKWINEQSFFRRKFNWQKGYGAFSYSRSQRDDVIKYIINQEEHHRKKTFREEYIEFLRNFEIEYNEKYIFEFYT